MFVEDSKSGRLLIDSNELLRSAEHILRAHLILSRHDGGDDQVCRRRESTKLRIGELVMSEVFAGDEQTDLGLGDTRD
jgi:hypothetical protein